MNVTYIQVIFLDGYKDWNVTKTKTKQLFGEFGPALCLEAFNSLMNEDLSSLDDLCSEKPVTRGNVITCMGEEEGIVFVGINS